MTCRSVIEKYRSRADMRYALMKRKPMIDWNEYPHFSMPEFMCKCGCGRADMDPDFIGRLQDLRDVFNAPIRISSGFRCPDHNDRVSSTGRDGPHTTGKAADILVSGRDARDLVALADEFTGIGISQKGDHASRFIHLDTLTAPDAPRPWIWSY